MKRATKLLTGVISSQMCGYMRLGNERMKLPWSSSMGCHGPSLMPWVSAIFIIASSPANTLQFRTRTKSPSTLNDHATWRAKKPDQDLPVEVTTTFQALIRELERDPKEDISGGTTPLSRAYHAYRLACMSNSHLL